MPCTYLHVSTSFYKQHVCHLQCRLRTCGHFRLSSTQLVAFLVLHVQPHRCLRSCLSAFYAHVRLSGPRPHRQIKRSFCYEDPGCCTTRRIQRTTTDGPTHAALTPRCSVKFGATSTLPTHPTAHPASPTGRLLHEAQPGQRPSHGQDLLPYTMPGAQRHATCRVRGQSLSPGSGLPFDDVTPIAASTTRVKLPDKFPLLLLYLYIWYNI